MTQSIEQINQNLWESLAYDMKFNMELWYLGEIQGYNILAKFYINMSDEKIVRSSVEDRLQLGEVHTYEELLDSVAGQCGLQTSREQVREIFPAKQLLEFYKKGQDRRVTECQCRMQDGTYRWVRLTAKLRQDTDHGDIMALFYIHDVDRSHIRKSVVKAIMNYRYDFFGILNVETGFFNYMAPDEDETELTIHHGIYHEYIAASIEKRRKYFATEKDYQRIRSVMEIEHLKKMLENHPTYEFDIEEWDEQHKKLHIYHERFRYMDADKEQILFGRMDMTDTVAEERKQKELVQQMLKEAESALEVKNRFMALISHDIRTPLNAIMGMAQLLELDPSKKNVQECIQTIRDSGNFLLGLIDDILDASRMEKGGFKLEEELETIENFERLTRINIKPMMDAKKQNFYMDMACGFNTVMVDGKRFNQLFFNLLSNASKYTPEGGHISFTSQALRKEGCVVWIRFRVKDDGIGMSREFMEHAFEPFTRERKNEESGIEGSGLGLSIAKEIVDAMQGQITIQSEVGAGTEFIVDLPLKPVSPEMEEEQPEIKTELDTEKLQGKRVLLVEDNLVNYKIAKKLLEYVNMEVTRTDNGEMGVRAFMESQPGYFDVILMDIFMPVMDGLEAARAIRASGRPDAGSVPIIAMTANAYEEDRKRSREAGMNGHITKPISKNFLYKTLLEVV